MSDHICFECGAVIPGDEYHQDDDGHDYCAACCPECNKKLWAMNPTGDAYYTRLARLLLKQEGQQCILKT